MSWSAYAGGWAISVKICNGAQCCVIYFGDFYADEKKVNKADCQDMWLPKNLSDFSVSFCRFAYLPNQ